MFVDGAGDVGLVHHTSKSSSAIASSRDLVRARKFATALRSLSLDAVLAQHVVQHGQRMPAPIIAFAGIDAERALWLQIAE